MPSLEKEVRFLKGVGEKRAALFSRLGIHTLRDLIEYFPRSYEDFSTITDISAASPGVVCCIRAAAETTPEEASVRAGMILTRFVAADATGRIVVTFFNNRYIKNIIKTGQEYLFYGKLTLGPVGKQMASPEFSDTAQTGLRPCYSLTAGLTNRMLRDAQKQALTLCQDEFEDCIPSSLRQKHGLCHRRYAVFSIHFPKTAKELETARRRLAFEELLNLQLGLSALKRGRRECTAAVCGASARADEFLSALPFTPTAAQRRAVREGCADMCRETPMSRLLQGDVGSGKTAVAAALCWFAAKNGFQSAFMAPTEILARQHYHTLLPLFEKFGVKTGLLTGGMTASEKKQTKKRLSDGEIDVLVGTHALLQGDVRFHSLGLVVTDEQHRFGVGQRAALFSKGRCPHTLIMSATPIPRTLSLIIYGDLDISLLDELPAGRRAVKTYLVDSSLRQRVYAFIRKYLDRGFQAYTVCPVITGRETDGKPGDNINETTADEAAAAEEYAADLAAGEFKDYRVGLLHGKLKAAEKDRVMTEFCEKKLSLLVSTTVIEVGVDVPNAVIMVIENAERFGLSQLHQLRGRVGRGAEQSYCILISNTDSGVTAKRLKTLCQTNDGFQIAEADLKLRGPGDFFGSRQHGLPELKIADIFNDIDLLSQSRQAAEETLSADPKLSRPENAGLRRNVDRLFESSGVIFN